MDCVHKFSLSLILLSTCSLEVARADIMLPKNYESLSACDKQNYLWNNKILPTQYSTLPELAGLDFFGFNSTDMHPTVERISDEMPIERIKHIHKRGVVATVAFEADANTPFTGLFKGASCGLLRTSVAVAPNFITPMVPGAALKFFIDGRPSRNFPFMPSLDGQGKNYNFFAFSFFTSIAEPKNFALKLLKVIFERVSKEPGKLSLNHLATFTQTGEKEPMRLAPEVMELAPTAAIQTLESPARDTRLDALAIPAGTEMFEVYDWTNGNRGMRLGKIVTTSNFVASQWGDDGLFFKHQRIEDQNAD